MIKYCVNRLSLLNYGTHFVCSMKRDNKLLLNVCKNLPKYRNISLKILIIIFQISTKNKAHCIERSRRRGSGPKNGLSRGLHEIVQPTDGQSLT